jgi:PAS domain S-box-containing protein
MSTPRGFRVSLVGRHDDFGRLRALLETEGEPFEIELQEPGLEGGLRPALVEAASPDVVVLGPSVANALALARQVRTISPKSQIVFILPPDRLERFRTSLPFVPQLASAWTASTAAAPSTLMALLGDAARASRERSAAALVLGRINQQLASGKTAPAQVRRSQLALSERYLATVLTQSPDGFIALGKEGTVIAYNDAAARMFGQALEAAQAGSALALFPRDERARVESLIARAWEGEALVRAEVGVDAPDGTRVYLEISLAPVTGDIGGIASVSITARDITERRYTEDRLRETEQRLNAVLDNASVSVFLMDERQHCIYMNAAAEELTGYRFEEVLGRPLHDVIHHKRPDGTHYPLQDCPIDRAFPERNRMRGEEVFVHKDGRLYPVAFTASPIRDESGEPVGTIIEVRDVAVEKAQQAALREANDTLKTLNRIGEALAAELDLERIVQMVTDAGVELTGAQFGAFFYNVLNEAGERFLLYTLSGADRSDFEHFGMPRATAVFQPTFKGEGVIRSDDILADPRYGRNAPHNGMPRGHLPVRSYLAVPVVSRSGEAIGGLFFGHPEPGRFSERHEQLMVGIAAQAAVAIDNARLYRNAQREVEERRRAEDALRESEARFRAITDSIDQLIWSTRPDGYHDYYNHRWYEYTGVPEGATDGEMWNDMFHPEDRERAQAIWRHSLQTGEPYHIEYRLRHRSGQYRWVLGRAQPMSDENGRIVRWYGTCTDIHDLKRAETALRDLNDTLEQRVRDAVAEREQAEEALRQAQKMEAVGQLTGGIAHDFNNLLTVVTGNIDMASRALDAAGVSDPRTRRSLDNALKGAERAASLTQRLLAFSRRQPLAPKALDVDKLVVGMSDLINRALGEMVRLEIVTSPGLWRVEADPNQLEAAILNLALNARDAMPEGGELVVETANARLDEEYCAAHAEVAPGQYVVIAVTDTGHGMSKETVARVFEPFFTTKGVGKGTGLGLSMVYGFVKQSGGHVKIYSEEGQGTTVKIYLPRLMSDAGAEDEAQSAQGLEVSQRAEAILVVEDDDDVRAYTVECLRELGYRVIEAHDGPSALRLMERQGQPVDLLFTDVVMPGMSGRELADLARERHPGLRVLYTSGYTRNAIVHGGRLDPGVEMIAKPFTYAALAQKVRDMLDAGRTGRILVVESEPTVRALAVEALTVAGYVAEEAANAAEALGKVRSAQGRYDAVFIDNGLPDRPGDALASELRALHADLPILLTSEGHESHLRRRFASDRCLAVIGKPYTGAKLVDALTQVGVRCSSKRPG